MRNAHQGSQTLVCVVGTNALAVRYIAHLLRSDLSLAVCGMDTLPSGCGAPQRVVYLLDGASLPMPLRQMLHLSAAMSPDRRNLLVDMKHSTGELLELMRNGLHGFVGHDDVEANLMTAIHAVATLSLWMPREVLRLYVESTNLSARRARCVDQMTDRESEILNLVNARLSNKEIAEILNIRESTVKFHLTNIFAKRNVTNRRALLPMPVQPLTRQKKTG